MNYLNSLNNEITRELIEKGIDPVLTKDGLKIEGFYKSNTMILKRTDHSEDSGLPIFIAIDRYKYEKDIYDFNDLVYLNHYWWLDAKERWKGEVFSEPSPIWKEEMIRLGLIKKIVKEHYE